MSATNNNNEWANNGENEPNDWYEHEVDESDYPPTSEYRQQSSSRPQNNADSNAASGSYERNDRGERSDRGYGNAHSSSGYSSQHTRYSNYDRERDRGDRPNSHHYERRDREGGERREYHQRPYHSSYHRADRDREREDGRYYNNRDDRRTDDRPERTYHSNREYDSSYREHGSRSYNHYASQRGENTSQQYSSPHRDQQYEGDDNDYREDDAPAEEEDQPEEEDEDCPLCMEKLDATDRQFKPCKCGYQVCLWCFHHINENLSGKCPACRRQYDTTGQMAADPTILETIAKGRGERKKRSRDAISSTSSSTAFGARKSSASIAPHDVRVLQRNLLYVVGLPLSLAKEDLLKRKEYFGKFGKILTVKLNLKTPMTTKTGGAVSLERKQTCSCYVTYKRGFDAVDAIKAVNGSVVLGCLLRATYGTSKYCASWLRGSPCNNPGCLYLHETADPKDCTSKEELSSFLQETQPNTIHPTAITQYGLPGATVNQAMLPGSAAMAPLLPMSRAVSLVTASPNEGVDGETEENSAGPQSSDGSKSVVQAQAAPSPASTPPPSSWASLASSRLVSDPSSIAKQPGQVVHAPVEPSPSQEVLMPNEIIYIAPPHLRGSAAAAGGRKLGSRTSSNASSNPPNAGLVDGKGDAKDSTPVASPSMDGETGSNFASASVSHAGSNVASPFVSPALSLGVGVVNVDSPSNLNSLQLSRPESNLEAAALSLAQAPISPSNSSLLAPAPSIGGSSLLSLNTDSRPPPGMGLGLGFPNQQPTPSPVGSRPPPGFFKAAPISQLQPVSQNAPPQLGGLNVGPPGAPGMAPGLSGLNGPQLGGPPLNGPPPSLGGPSSLNGAPTNQGAPSSQPNALANNPTPAVSAALQSLAQAFPLIDRSILAHLVQAAPLGLPNLNSLGPNVMTPQQQQQRQREQMAAAQNPGSQGGPPPHLMNGGAGGPPQGPSDSLHMNDPLTGFGRPPLSHPQGPPRDPNAPMPQHGPPSDFFGNSNHFGGPFGGPMGFNQPPPNQFGNLSPNRASQLGQMGHERHPSFQQQPQQLGPDGNHGNNANINGHGFHNNGNDWQQLLHDEDGSMQGPPHPRHSNPPDNAAGPLGSNWSNFSKLLQEVDQLKQQRQQNQFNHDPNEVSHMHPQQQQPFQHQQQQQPREQSRFFGMQQNVGGWNDSNTSGLNSPLSGLGGVNPSSSISSSNTNAPTSRYGFALEEDLDDRTLGGVRGGGGFGSHLPQAGAWSQSQQKPQGPQGIAGLNMINSGNNGNQQSNGWPQQQQQQQAPRQDDYAAFMQQQQQQQGNNGNGPNSFLNHDFGAPAGFQNPQQPTRAPLPRARNMLH